jgi:hypothetical protein
MKTNTHFCDYCGKEMWGANVVLYRGHEFCSRECVNGYYMEKVVFR